MKEFWLWVVIVSLIIFCLMGLSFIIIHVDKQLAKAEVILMRAEERDRKQKLAKEPVDE